MDFIVRILFSGLIAFIPSEDGTELDVLLLNVDHAYHSSDGTALANHKPLLITRAGSCTGQCPTRDSGIAEFLYADKTLAVALDSLEEAVGGGAAWALDGSELDVRKGSSGQPDFPALSLRRNVRGTANGQPLSIPTTSAEREDYSWVADLKQVCGSGCVLDPDVLADPPPGLVAARLRLRNGNVFTYAVARIGANVTPVHFKRLDGQGSTSPYSQAVASWVAADIEVQGQSIEIVETKFDGGAGRSMILTPDANDRIEVAMLNLPPFVPPATTANPTPEAGKHFEMYYELAQTPPSAATRLVPRAGAPAGALSYPEVDWQLIHPSSAVGSDLLDKLRLGIGRGPYDVTLCPPANP